MKLSRKLKLRIAAVSGFIAFILLIANESQYAAFSTLVLVKLAGLIFLSITSYICHIDFKKYGAPKEE